MEISIKESLASAISDMSKDLNGFRWRFDWENMTVEQLRALADDYSARLSERIREERIEEERRLDEWASRVADLARLFNVAQSDVVRWDMDAEEAQDLEQYAWSLGLPYRSQLVHAVAAGDAVLVAKNTV